MSAHSSIGSNEALLPELISEKAPPPQFDFPLRVQTGFGSEDLLFHILKSATFLGLNVKSRTPRFQASSFNPLYSNCRSIVACNRHLPDWSARRSLSSSSGLFLWVIIAIPSGHERDETYSEEKDEDEERDCLSTPLDGRRQRHVVQGVSDKHFCNNSGQKTEYSLETECKLDDSSRPMDIN